jgi:hypothetical protein
VNENVSATAARRLNKSIPLGRIEPLHCTFGHFQNSNVNEKIPPTLRERCLGLVFFRNSLECRPKMASWTLTPATPAVRHFA